MIKTPLYLFAAISLTALSGCMFTGNPLSKLWFYTYSNDRTTGRDTLLTPASFLELRGDGTYTRDFGRLSLPSEKEAEDPFSLANNRWRIPATHKEDKTIAWAHTDSKYKMFLSALQQMENFLR